MADERKYEAQDHLTPERVEKIRKELETNNEVKVGNAFLVRIPKIEGRIFIRKVDEQITYVEYIYEKWYDPEKKQNRNRRVTIGRYYRLFPGAMVPNEQYYQYFDRETGEARKEMKPMAEVKDGMTWEETKDRMTREDTTEQVKEEMENGNEGGETNMDQTDRGLKQAIQNVLVREGMILRKDQWVRQDEDENEDEEDDEEMEEEYEEMRRIQARKKRVRVLLDLLTSIRSVVKGQAKKRPDEIINLYQAQRFNCTLEEIRELVKGRGLEDMLELIKEPREVERNGKTVIEGMSYSDIEVLLEYYNSVIWFTQAEIKGGY